MKLRHRFISTKADNADSSFVKPSQWNEDHTVETDADAIILGRRVGETAGPVTELPIGISTVSALFDRLSGIFRAPGGTNAQRPTVANLLPGDMRVNTQSSRLEVWDGFAWINIALGEVAFVGALEWSIRNTTPNGWILFSGSLGPVGSFTTNPRDDARALYNLCWALPATVFPMVDLGVRGASSDIDWAAKRGITFPDWRGRTFAIAENIAGGTPPNILGTGAAGGFPTTASLFDLGGEKSHVLTIAEMPEHDHVASNSEHSAGSDASGTANFSGWPELSGKRGDGATHNNVQPTVMLYCYIKL